MKNSLTRELINLDFTDSKLIVFFETLKKHVNFDEAMIVFFNPDSISIKYTFPYDAELENKILPLDSELSAILFDLNNEIIKNNIALNKILPFKNTNNIVISKLFLKNIFYGAIVYSSKDDDILSEETEDRISEISSILAYKIKDKELSDIFRVQLKSLQDSYIKIKEQNLQIVKLDKIKSEFLANITHELRTPLSAIIGFSEMLKTKLLGDLNKKQEEYVDDIYISGVHLLGMINEILDISKIESRAMSLNKVNFEISRALSEVLNVIQPLAIKKNLEIKTAVEDIKICADFQKVKQILYNLISNAIKFTMENGNIEVVISNDGSNLYIKVKDNGIGIAKENHKIIFEKFMQLENAYTKTGSSTGLGLTITKTFVEMHNGNINVESELNKGSIFKVKLPIKLDK